MNSMRTSTKAFIVGGILVAIAIIGGGIILGISSKDPERALLIYIVCICAVVGIPTLIAAVDKRDSENRASRHR